MIKNKYDFGVVVPYKTTLSTSYNGTNYSIEYPCKLLSSNASDETLDDWQEVNKPYAQHAEVKIPALKRRYISKIANNNDYPVGSLNWVDMGALNSWAVADNHVTHRTESDETLVFEVDAANANTLGLMDIKDATSVTIEYLDKTTGLALMESKTISLVDFGVLNPYDYMNKPRRFKTQYIDTFQPHPNLKIKVTIPYVDTTIGIGAMPTGVRENTGVVLRGGDLTYDDKSLINIDDWGNVTYVRRGVLTIINAKILMNESDIDTSFRTYIASRAQRNLYILNGQDTKIESINVMGHLKTTKIPLEEVSESPITIVGVQ